MKSFNLLIVVALTLLLSCKQSNRVAPQQPEPKGPKLSRVIETRYTPLDSITITYLYNSMGKLTEEQYSSQPPRRAYSLFHLYQPVDLTLLKQTNNEYRFYNVSSQGQLNASKKYFATSTTYWTVYDSDTLIYRRGQLVSQYHWDYYFLADYQGGAFKFPLWLTKRSVNYDSRYRLSAEIDSVFRTHDIPAGSLMIQQRPATYLFTNQTTYKYNERDEVIQKVTVSGADAKPSLTYGNGSSIYHPFGPTYAYFTYNQSWPGRFLSGITTYSYEYGADSLVRRKTVQFEWAATKQRYVSSFDYTY